MRIMIRTNKPVLRWGVSSKDIRLGALSARLQCKQPLFMGLLFASICCGPQMAPPHKEGQLREPRASHRQSRMLSLTPLPNFAADDNKVKITSLPRWPSLQETASQKGVSISRTFL